MLAQLFNQDIFSKWKWIDSKPAKTNKFKDRRNTLGFSEKEKERGENKENVKLKNIYIKVLVSHDDFGVFSLSLF